MLIKSTRNAAVLYALFFTIVISGALQALEEPRRSGLGLLQFRSPILEIENTYRLPKDLPAQALANAVADLNALGLRSDSAYVDTRGGRWANLLLAEPLLPGRGKGNGLSWAYLGRGVPKNNAEISHAASQAFRGYLEANSHPLRIDLDELAGSGKVTVHRDGTSIQIFIPRVLEGVPVRGSHLAATISHGNLILFGTKHWGDIDAETEPGIAEDDAWQTVQAYVEPYSVNGVWSKTELLLIPVAKGQNMNNVAVGRGFEYRLAWLLRPAFDGESDRFEALVDAHSGQLLSFEDTNQYAEIKGGVYPVTNDGVSPDGVEQPGWPMPYADATGGTSDTGGNIATTGSVTTDFYGPYVNINDQCGTSSLTSSTGVLDWGTSNGTDCATPGFGGAGNTHSSRTGFYELNKMIEMARGQLPSNSWLQSRLVSNMNRTDLYCPGNAWWNGTVNFCRSSASYSNTGEIAGVFDHEWGHGMDANDATPGIANPSGEGIADIYTALRLNDSCIGRNFRKSGVCSGFGDPCLTCSGVRDIDYLKRASGQPHDYTWSNANCGGSVHCVGAVYAEAVWSLWKRELQSAPYNYDNDTAQEIVTRLTFIGAGNTGTWFSGGPPNGGCAAGSGYMNYLAADDDNGNLNDGTPHMTAIFNAFDDQEIACGTPTVQDSGCAGVPTAAPSVTAARFDKSVDLSWSAVAGAASYEIFRTEGVFGCDFGKVRLGETTGTTFNDSGLQNGREYSYVVIPKGSSAACFGPASSCTSAVPAAGPNLNVDVDSAALSIHSGDGDGFIDNCEDATLSFEVTNVGLGSLTDVQITGVTVISPAGTTIDPIFPVAVLPSSLAEGEKGIGSFDLTAGGLSFGDTLVFEVTVTADEISSAKTFTLTIENAESDLQFQASKTWDFEADLQGWTVIQGTFAHSTAVPPGGAGGSSGFVASSSYLNEQCDQVRSPAFRLTSSSTLSIQTNYNIEHFDGQWWDRANVAFFDGGARNVVDPDGGRPYNASGPSSNCATIGENGWADTESTWAASNWSASALDSTNRAGIPTHLDIAYGTDPAVVGQGFWFDQVTLTDVEFLVADTQSNSCTCTVDADCDNGLFCDGAETCSAGTCQAGTPPACDDGISCTDDSCNEATASCDKVANDANCDNGLFCDGAETCDAILDCQSGTAPLCPDDGLFCNGVEACNEASNDCTGTPPVIDDGVGCTNDSCDEVNGVVNAPDDANCDNGLFCDGAETCDATNDCQAGSDPCSGATCDEEANQCLVPTVHVASVATGTVNAEAGRGFKHGTATVTIVNDIEQPVSGYTVTGAFGGSFSETHTEGTTDGNGEISFQTDSTDKGVTVTFCVSPNSDTSDGVADGVAGALPYDPSANQSGTTCGELPPEPSCGNNTIETGEVCDGSDLGGETCVSMGYTSGTLACLSDCSDYDTAECVGEPSCIPTHSKEKGPRCSDGLDNDCDGLTDNADPDC